MTPLEEMHDGPRWWAVVVIWVFVVCTAPFWLSLVVIMGWHQHWRNQRERNDR